MSRILLVEDEQHLAEGLRFNLTAEHHDVQVVDSGEAALRVLSDERPRVDVLISDIGMPDLDGYELIRRVRSLFPPSSRVASVVFFT